MNAFLPNSFRIVNNTRILYSRLHRSIYSDAAVGIRRQRKLINSLLFGSSLEMGISIIEKEIHCPFLALLDGAVVADGVGVQ
jgi:hypothetical protein